MRNIHQFAMLTNTQSLGSVTLYSLSQWASPPPSAAFAVINKRRTLARHRRLDTGRWYNWASDGFNGGGTAISRIYEQSSENHSPPTCFRRQAPLRALVLNDIPRWPSYVGVCFKAAAVHLPQYASLTKLWYGTLLNAAESKSKRVARLSLETKRKTSPVFGSQAL